MKRLVRKPASSIRALQISRVRLHIFVEGRDIDSVVYGKICQTVLPDLFDARIVRADELNLSGTAKGGGGKRVLTLFHDRLRRAGQLRPTLGGYQSSTLFFLDKDLDDLKRKKKRSAHITYTSTYDIEGQVVIAGDISGAIMSSLSVTPQILAAKLVGQTPLVRAATQHWQHWVEICVAAQLGDVRSVPNYGVPSKVNTPLDAPANTQLVSSYWKLIEQAFKSSGVDHNAIRRRATGVVQRHYAANRELGIFKGKWYRDYLPVAVSRMFPVEARRTKDLGGKLFACLIATLDYSAPWADPYRDGIRAALAKP